MSKTFIKHSLHASLTYGSAWKVHVVHNCSQNQSKVCLSTLSMFSCGVFIPGVHDIVSSLQCGCLPQRPICFVRGQPLDFYCRGESVMSSSNECGWQRDRVLIAGGKLQVARMAYSTPSDN